MSPTVHSLKSSDPSKSSEQYGLHKAEDKLRPVAWSSANIHLNNI